MKTTILLTIHHEKEVPELTDLIANRIYTMLKNADRSADVTAEIVQPETSTYGSLAACMACVGLPF